MSTLADDLRATADLIDDHPTWRWDFGGHASVHIPSPETLEDFVRSFGGWDQVTHKLIGDTRSTLNVEARVGGVRVIGLGSASTLCEPMPPVEPVYSIRGPRPKRPYFCRVSSDGQTGCGAVFVAADHAVTGEAVRCPECSLAVDVERDAPELSEATVAGWRWDAGLDAWSTGVA